VSYRGKPKGNYGPQKRSRFHNPFHRKNRNKNAANQQSDFKINPNPPASEVQPSPIPPQPFELWLKGLLSWTYNPFRAQLSDDPAQLQAQAVAIAELASKRRLQIELVLLGATKLFDVLSIQEVETPETPVPLDPQVEQLRTALSGWGYTLVQQQNETVTNERAAPVKIGRIAEEEVKENAP
jgi:hypothetical protein